LLFQVLDLLFLFVCFPKQKQIPKYYVSCKQAIAKKRRKAEKQTNNQLQQQPTHILTVKKKTQNKKKHVFPLQLENTEMIKKCTNY